ncbi:B-box zinc finger protein 32-like [Panicum virgatum]|uniref:B box-type domain-containing protein n=1 Tax=Panicum virgatum TaxID=38727 RepID=A0A8T0TXE7_PANVG|nr:B-box zinc finger protein 32-like [Panicum virgatum]KAG2613466.1 hypothetical protein PVAP13_4KG353976 [Panicum virgatum]
MGRGGGSGVAWTGAAGCGCELCGAPAAVHCAADAAFLCAACDAKVHGANFLAARHRRTRLLLLLPPVTAQEEEEDEGYASAASSCVSAADSASTARGGRARAGRPPRRGAAAAAAAGRAEVVLEAWAKRMGLAPGAARLRAAAAWRALRARGSDAAAARVPPRVAMAAALWREVAAGGGGASHGHGDALRRLEACAHVPARLVVAVATSLLARARARRRGPAVEEGWDECAWAGPKSNPARP